MKIWKGLYLLWGCSIIWDITNMKTLVRVSREVFVRRERTVRVAPNYWKEVAGDEHWLLTVISLPMTWMQVLAIDSTHQPRSLWFEVLLVIWRVLFPLLNNFIITGCCQHPSFQSEMMSSLTFCSGNPNKTRTFLVARADMFWREALDNPLYFFI